MCFREDLTISGLRPAGFWRGSSILILLAGESNSRNLVWASDSGFLAIQNVVLLGASQLAVLKRG